MERVLLGWPPEGPTLRLDHRRFSYAGKFVMSNTGKAIVRRTAEDVETDTTDSDGYDSDVLAAVAFNADRTDPDALWLRYVTVRDDYRGEGLGPGLCRFVARRAADRGYGTVSIAVNNPFAYEALYRAGFGFGGRETGLAELVLTRPAAEPLSDRSPETYQAGLDRYRDGERELSAAEVSFLDRKRGASPPKLAEPPPS